MQQRKNTKFFITRKFIKESRKRVLNYVLEQKNKSFVVVTVNGFIENGKAKMIPVVIGIFNTKNDAEQWASKNITNYYYICEIKAYEGENSENY